ncbi:MAG TPA: zinc ribbon domain-containing protein [Candidatus Pullilachnospira intestinigallinarum]|nr:zinc ribbon domain-containing protein [Candidatus Pullilachnospira intestinigallinarum]
MKCPHCGAPMALDDKFCPYCGQANTLAKKHQADMEHYQKEFQETRRQVYRETSRFTRLAVPITILFVLFLLNLAVYLVWSQSWEIGSALMRNRIADDSSTHEARFQEYLEDGDYMGLSGYYDANSLYLSDTFDEYRAVLQGADTLGYIFQQIQYTFSGETRPDEEDLERLADTLSNLIPQVYQLENQYSYNTELYLSEDKQAHIRAIQDLCSALLIRYAGLSREDTLSLPDLSESRILQLLRERMVENR